MRIRYRTGQITAEVVGLILTRDQRHKICDEDFHKKKGLNQFLNKIFNITDYIHTDIAQMNRNYISTMYIPSLTKKNYKKKIPKIT